MTDSNRPPDDFQRLLAEEPGPKEEQITALEQQLVKERDERKEERFYFVVGILILVDLWNFPSMETWAGPIAVLFLELILIMSLARRSGMEEAMSLIDRVVGAWRRP